MSNNGRPFLFVYAVNSKGMHRAHKHSYHAKIELTRNRNKERVLDDE